MTRNFQEYIYDFGAPDLLILDNAAELPTAQLKEMCKSFNIKMGFTTLYHPRGNSLSERMHKTMKGDLTSLWPKFLEETQRIINTSVHTTIGDTPHFTFFSRQISAELPQFEDSDLAESR